MQHVPNKSDGRVEKDTVTFDEEKGEITFVEEGHDVERVAAIHKNPHHYEIYWRNIRDKLRMKIGVWIITAKDTMSAVVKPVRRIEELTSDAIDYCRASHLISPTTCAPSPLSAS